MAPSISKTFITLLFILVSSSRLYAEESAKITPIVTGEWQEAVVSVYDIESAARFFKKLGGYQTIWEGEEDPTYLSQLGLEAGASANSLLLKAPGADFAYLRLIKFQNTSKQVPMRPGSRPWDSGCYSSIMVRAKNLNDVYDDAIRLGWWTETPVTEFVWGDISLKIIIFKGPQGIQVQAYERINPPLSPEYPEFDKISVPFNIMQTVRERKPAADFFTKVLGFDVLSLGEPLKSAEPAQIPLGIPINLTTTSQYQAGIFYPTPGEFGRTEIVEFLDLDGVDYADRCNAPNFGTLSIKYEVDSVRDTRERLTKRGLTQEMKITNTTIAPYGSVDIFSIKSPDGANIEFYSKQMLD